MALVIEAIPPKASKKMPTILEQLKKLDEQRNQLLDNAKTELLKKAEDAISELNQLGFNYRLTQGESGGTKKKTGASKPAAERHCDVCDMNGHDARAHRNQNPKKKFTAKELAEKGLA